MSKRLSQSEQISVATVIRVISLAPSRITTVDELQLAAYNRAWLQNLTRFPLKQPFLRRLIVEESYGFVVTSKGMDALTAKGSRELSEVDKRLTLHAAEASASRTGIGGLEIQFAILELMKDRRVWSNAELKRTLAGILPLTEHDRNRSNTRENEAVWENRVNNALSWARSSSLYEKGFVESAGHGLHVNSESGLALIHLFEGQ